MSERWEGDSNAGLISEILTAFLFLASGLLSRTKTGQGIVRLTITLFALGSLFCWSVNSPKVIGPRTR